MCIKNGRFNPSNLACNGRTRKRVGERFNGRTVRIWEAIKNCTTEIIYSGGKRGRIVVKNTRKYVRAV